MTSICLHCFVSGRVQGVFFRDKTRRKAEEAGVTGWVRNLNDGRVEVVLCGERQAVLKMRDWLWEGPTAAKVSAVEFTEIPCEAFTKFEIRRT